MLGGMHRAPANGILVSAFRNRLFGLDTASGQIRWEVSVGKTPSEVEIAIEDGVVIAAVADGIAFVDYRNGDVLAMVPLQVTYKRRPTMLVSNGLLFVGTDGEVSCFTIRGQPVWMQSFSGKGLGSVALGVPGAVRQADAEGKR